MSDWPRVTAILQAAQLGVDYSMVPPAILHQAKMRGVAVHAAVEAIGYGYFDDLYPPEAELPEDCVPYVAAYRAFVKESGHTATLSEFTVRHPQWRYVGHPDRLGWLCGKRAVIEWKCIDSLDLRPATLQLAGYLLGREAEVPAERIDVTAVVQLRSDGTYRLHEVDARAAAPVFLAAVTIWWAREEMRT